MTLFSANLGFLWAELPLPQAIHAAKNAGFDAVECHWPYATPPEDTRAALTETGLEMLGLNTPKGAGFGLTALDDASAAQAAIDEAIAYAAAIDARAIHVMAGIADGPAAHQAFCQNLAEACHKAAPHDLTILIEPINTIDVPGYFLNRISQALDVVEDVAAPNLKIMVDAYHIARMEGARMEEAIIRHLDQAFEAMGHFQFAGVPHRGAPDEGEVDFAAIFDHLKARGYSRPLGAEYKPSGGDTDASLNWMKTLKTSSERI
ncbi:MAG: TIM barrel protein [Alphaproteobacteria bacterium]|nr:TIM barrel protein [Alphaproteobacteria bacterium]